VENGNALVILVLVIIFSLLLTSELPMFSLKFKNLSWQSNKTTYIFLIISAILIAALGVTGFAAAILLYIVMSVVKLFV
jgi:CDP-diacylglycerol--serine O-phosphatidyltransferase